jgi:ADP-ribose pyrophosphatase YjhB (NUDIX family)
MSWPPHITVAAIVEENGKFLMVEETSGGKLVYNQPAGHLDPNETLAEACVREAFEETGWHIEVTHVLGVSRYTSEHNGTLYYRTSFIAKALEHDKNAKLDDGIERAVWLSYEDLKAEPEKLRSPLVLKNIEQYLAGECYPLSMIVEQD